MKTKLAITLLPMLLCASSGAAVLNLDSSARGVYDNTGQALTTDSYRTGSAGTELRSWFTFDLSSALTPVSAASFVITAPAFGYESDDSSGDTLNATETFSLYDVTSTGLAADGTAGHAAIFADLGSGSSYGSIAVSEANDGGPITITLSPAFITRINANLGGTISIGGALAGMDNNPLYNRFLFNGSNTGNPADGNTRLILTSAVPEPGVYGACGVTALALAAARRRSKRRVL